MKMQLVLNHRVAVHRADLKTWQILAEWLGRMDQHSCISIPLLLSLLSFYFSNTLYSGCMQNKLIG